MTRGVSNLPAQCGDDGRGVLAGHLDQDDETRMPFDQGGDVSVLAACQQIALPVTGDGAVLDLRWPLADGDGIDDLTLGVACSSSMYGATDESLRAKMLNQLLFQHASSLDK